METGTHKDTLTVVNFEDTYTPYHLNFAFFDVIPHLWINFHVMNVLNVFHDHPVSLARRAQLPELKISKSREVHPPENFYQFRTSSTTSIPGE